MRVRALVVATIALVIGVAALAQASAAGGGADGVPRFGHVFVIIGENTDYQHLTTTNAPYLMTTIRPSSAWFDNYFSATHWSQANYVALMSGQFTACEQSDRGYSCPAASLREVAALLQKGGGFSGHRLVRFSFFPHGEIERDQTRAHCCFCFKRRFARLSRECFELF